MFGSVSRESENPITRNSLTDEVEVIHLLIEGPGSHITVSTVFSVVNFCHSSALHSVTGIGCIRTRYRHSEKRDYERIIFCLTKNI